MHGIPIHKLHNTAPRSSSQCWRRFSDTFHNLFQRPSWEVRWSKYARKQCRQIHSPIQQQYRFHKMLSWGCNIISSTIRNICVTVSIRSQDCVLRRVLQIHRWNVKSGKKEESLLFISKIKKTIITTKILLRIILTSGTWTYYHNIVF